MPLLKVILFSQVANGILLPFVLVFMLMLINKPLLMGPLRNGKWENAIAITTSVTMIALTILMVWNAVRG